MSWEAIGSIGELIGALAVLATLVYLARQIRQHNREMENQVKSVDLASFNAIDESFSRFRSLIAADGQLAELWRRAKEDYLSLAPDERERADALIWEWFMIYQNMNHRVSEISSRNPVPVHTEDDEDYLKLATRLELDHAGLRQWWEAGNSQRFFPVFRAMVNDFWSECDG